MIDGGVLWFKAPKVLHELLSDAFFLPKPQLVVLVFSTQGFPLLREVFLSETANDTLESHRDA